MSDGWFYLYFVVVRQIKCVWEIEREREKERESEEQSGNDCAVQGKTVSVCLFSRVWFWVAAADDPPWQKNTLMSTFHWTRLNSARGPQGPWKNIFSSKVNGGLQDVNVCLCRFWPLFSCLSCFCLFTIDTTSLLWICNTFCCTSFLQLLRAANVLQGRIAMQEKNAANSRNKTKLTVPGPGHQRGQNRGIDPPWKVASLNQENYIVHCD